MKNIHGTAQNHQPLVTVTAPAPKDISFSNNLDEIPDFSEQPYNISVNSTLENDMNRNLPTQRTYEGEQMSGMDASDSQYAQLATAGGSSKSVPVLSPSTKRPKHPRKETETHHRVSFKESSSCY